jgi:hypothetical protein
MAFLQVVFGYLSFSGDMVYYGLRGRGPDQKRLVLAGGVL